MIFYKLTLVAIIAAAIELNPFREKGYSNQNIPLEINYASGFQAGKSLLRFEAGYSDDPSSFDPFVIYYEERASFKFDGQYDALKLYNTDAAVPNFYVFGNDGNKLSINGIPSNCESSCSFHLGLKTEREGEIIIRVMEIEGNYYSDKTISLTDTKINKTQVLYPKGEYRVYLNAGDYQTRFILNISGNQASIQNFSSMEKELSVYLSHGVIIADILIPPSQSGLVTLYDPAGRVRLNQKVQSSGRYGLHPVGGPGIYIVSFVIECTRTYRKIMIID
jgi:hypothetical protein